MVDVEELEVTYRVRSQKEKTLMSAIALKIPSENIDLEISFASSKHGERLSLSDYDMMDDLPEVNLRAFETNIFVAPFFLRDVRDDSRPQRLIYPDDILTAHVFKLLRSQTPGNVGDSTIRQESIRVLSSNSWDDAQIEQLEKTAGTQTFRKFYKHLRAHSSSASAQRASRAWKAPRAFLELEILAEKLEETFTNVTYLGPARARSERFYRKQELEVAEIAPDGQNFPMFLASLGPTKLRGRTQSQCNGHWLRCVTASPSIGTSMERDGSP